MAAALVARGARVAIVGAGAAGLAAARAVRDGGYRATVFEAATECGGTWNYGDVSGKSSMYENLRCNLPKEIMQFRDVPFPHSRKSFLGHQQVHQYLLNYANTFSLRDLIRFRTKVVRITPSTESAWSVTVTNDESGTPASSELLFDAVVVANGHYSIPNPYLPPGTKRFQVRGGRTVTHSHVYRTPEPFLNRRVVVLGAGPSGTCIFFPLTPADFEQLDFYIFYQSGQIEKNSLILCLRVLVWFASSVGTDIALDLARTGAAEVFLSHRRGAGREPYGGIVPQVAAINSLTEDGAVLLTDGSMLSDIDDVLLCTGYTYSLPFLDPKAGVRTSADARCVYGLVEQCVSLKNPTLSIIGIPWKVVPFPLFEDQASFAVAVLSGDVSSEKLYALHRREMKEFALLGLEGKYIHCLDDRQWEYRRRLSDLTKRPLPSHSSIEIYNDSRAARLMDARSYREREYKIYGEGPGEWQVFENGEDVTGRYDPDPYSASRPFFSEIFKN